MKTPMSVVQKLRSFITNLAIKIGRIHWSTSRKLSEQELDIIRMILKENYYIILTRRSNFISTYVIGLTDFFIRRRFSYYTHALMNMQNIVTNEKDYRLVESTFIKGVGYSTFEEVFGSIQSVCFLKPKNMTTDDWALSLEKSLGEIGKPYDSLFYVYDNKKLSCIEFVIECLKIVPSYNLKFYNFERLFNKYGNITPQMLRDCGDLEVILEIKK